MSLHGTGTSLGDLIEVTSILSLRSLFTTLTISTSKCLLGHTEGSAGVVSIVDSLVCAMSSSSHGFRFCRNFNPHLYSDTHDILRVNLSRAYVPMKKIQLTSSSSFGMSGVNAHTLLLVGRPRMNRAVMAHILDFQRFEPNDMNVSFMHDRMPFTSKLFTEYSIKIDGHYFQSLHDHRVNDVVILPATTSLLLHFMVANDLSIASLFQSHTTFLYAIDSNSWCSISLRRYMDGQIELLVAGRRSTRSTLRKITPTITKITKSTRPKFMDSIHSTLPCFVSAKIQQNSEANLQRTSQLLDSSMHSLSCISRDVQSGVAQSVYIPVSICSFQTIDVRRKMRFFSNSAIQPQKLTSEHSINQVMGLNGLQCCRTRHGTSTETYKGPGIMHANSLYALNWLAIATVTIARQHTKHFWGDEHTRSKTVIQTRRYAEPCIATVQNLPSSLRRVVCMSAKSFSNPLMQNEMSNVVSSSAICSIPMVATGERNERQQLHVRNNSMLKHTRQISTQEELLNNKQIMRSQCDKNTLYVPSLQFSRKVPLNAYTLVPKPRGAIKDLTPISLSSLSATTRKEDTFVKCKVVAVGLNFRDVLNVLNMYPGDLDSPGTDFAGIINDTRHYMNGDAVFGLTNGCLSDEVRVHRSLWSLKPPSVGFRNASALPTVFLTVDECFHVARTCERDSRTQFLVHGASGGVGARYEIALSRDG